MADGKDFGGMLNSFNPFSGGGAAPTGDSASTQGGTAFPSASPSPDQMVSPSTATGTGSPVVPGVQSSSGSGDWLGNTLSSLSGAGKTVAPLIAGGGLINSIIGGTGKIPQKGNLENVAGQAMASGQQEVNAANAGQLPPGLESQLDQQMQAQIQAIQAKYAGMGLAGSTMEQQEIQNIQSQNMAAKEQAVQSYLQQGLSTENSAGADYAQIGQLQMAQQKDMATQIQNFLKAMAGGGGSSAGGS